MRRNLTPGQHYFPVSIRHNRIVTTPPTLSNFANESFEGETVSPLVLWQRKWLAAGSHSVAKTLRQQRMLRAHTLFKNKNSPVELIYTPRCVSRVISRALRARSSHSPLLFALLFVTITPQRRGEHDDIFPSWKIRFSGTRMLAQLAPASLAGLANCVASKLSH
jgi:hypothetical protein